MTKEECEIPTDFSFCLNLDAVCYLFQQDLLSISNVEKLCSIYWDVVYFLSESFLGLLQSDECIHSLSSCDLRTFQSVSKWNCPKKLINQDGFYQPTYP